MHYDTQNLDIERFKVLKIFASRIDAMKFELLPMLFTKQFYYYGLLKLQKNLEFFILLNDGCILFEPYLWCLNISYTPCNSYIKQFNLVYRSATC